MRVCCIPNAVCDNIPGDMVSLRPVLFVLILFATGGCNQEKLARLEKENKELAAKLDAAVKTAGLDLQQRCAQQSRAEFKEAGWGKEPMASFVNHYNSKLNKCFIEIVSMRSYRQPPIPTISKTVADAFEGKVYGEYMWINPKGDKYWEVKPFACKVTSMSGEELFCDSPEQFDSLVKQFMEQ
jgi:hypothetical protein